MTAWHQEALDMCQQGYGVEDIAVKFGVTRAAVYKLLTRSSIDGPKPLKNRDTEKRVLEAYYIWADLNVAGLAKRLEMKAAEVAAILARAGLPEAKGLDK